MWGGLIAGALKGGADATEELANVEIKKNAELDLRKQLMDAELEKQQRLAEIKIAFDTDPNNINRLADADKLRKERGLQTDTELAPKVGLAKDAERVAMKPVEDAKAADIVTRKITGTKTMAADDEFVGATRKLDIADQAGEIEAAKQRSLLGGAGGPLRVHNTEVGPDGKVYAIMNDGSTRSLGITSEKYNARVLSQIVAMERLRVKINGVPFSKLSEAEKRKAAEARVLGQSGLNPDEDPPAPSSSTTGRPPLDSFKRP